MSSNPCEVNANNIRKLEERVLMLEKHREKDKDDIHNLDISLKVFINEMKNISGELKTLVDNFKETVNLNNSAHEKDYNRLKEEVQRQGVKLEKLDAKLESETVEADAKKWREVTKYIATAILGLIIGYIATQLGLK